VKAWAGKYRISRLRVADEDYRASLRTQAASARESFQQSDGAVCLKRDRLLDGSGHADRAAIVLGDRDGA
jgi:hypothetical protein